MDRSGNGRGRAGEGDFGTGAAPAVAKAGNDTGPAVGPVSKWLNFPLSLVRTAGISPGSTDAPPNAFARA